ncbi:DUF934 domain-containing protein [Gammaproteobacteria bacterium]|nr:DUF934 domain-containing protein [Gammaproteobacteria bacterium]
MPTLIKDRQLIDNPWRLLEKDVDLNAVLSDTAEHIVVPFALWQEHKDSLMDCAKEIAVWLDSEDDPYELANDVIDLPLICLNFPVFRDGRAFSAAVILRERLNYQGEIRAIGDVLRDQLFYMQKCGIDSFDLADGVNVANALEAFNDFSTSYMSTVEEPLPLFRRR